MIAQLERLLTELKSNDAIAIERDDFGDPAEPALIAAMKKQHGLSDKALSPWVATDGFSLHWTAAVGDYELKGGIQMPDLERVLGSWKDSFYFDETPANDPKRRFHPIDDYDADFGSGHAAGWLLDGSPDPRVVYHDTDLEIHSLAPDILAYLDLVVATRGGLYWQQALLNVRKRASVSREFQKGFPKLFRGFDLKKLK